MSKKLHSGLKRTLAWMLVVALMVQGCMVVYADDFTSEPDAAVVADEISVESDNIQNDLEAADEDASVDVESPDESDADIGEEVTVEEEQADEAGVDEFSDGDNISAFSDGADDTDSTDDLKDETGKVDIAGGQQYSYHRLYDKDGYVRYAVGTYPADGSGITLKVGDQRGMLYRTLYTSTSSKYTDYTRASWSDATSNNMGYYQKGVEWSSSDENVAKIVKNSTYGPWTSGVWVEGVSEGTATITSTWTAGTKYIGAVKTITNTFTVTVTEAAEQVNIGDTFTLEGTATTPYLTTKTTSTNVASLWGRTSEINYNASGDGLETAQASWKVWTDTGIITHRFCINFGEMVGRTPQQSDNTTYTPSPSDSMSDKFLRPCVMPPDGIYITSVSSDKGSVVDGNVVFNKATGTSNPLYMYSYCISNQQKVDSATYYQNVQYTSSDETVVKKYKQDKYSVQLNALKAGTATLTAEYQPVDAEGNAVGAPITKDIKVIVCGFYIDEKAADGTNTIEMSLDDESVTKKINYKVIDATGEGEAAEPITWTVDNPAVASVDSDGVVKAKAAGETTVTAQYGDSSVNKDTVKIIVKGAGSLAFDKVESKIKKDGTDTIKATATYNGSTVKNADIKWESENPEIATVDGGKITGVGYGTTTVKASWTADNGKTYTNSAEVSVVYDGLYLSEAQNEVTMAQGSTQEILWQILDMGEYSKGSTGNGYNTSSDVTWVSANEDVATVDSAGVVTAKALPEGETTASTTITVSYKENKAKEIKVNVIDNQKIATGTTVEVAGTKGEQVTSKTDGSDISNEWKAGSYKNGHGSLNAQFNSNRDNFDIVDGTGSTATVTGKTPSEGYAYLSHKYYLKLETGQNCVVWEGIAVKVTGEAGLYLDKSSVSMKMGESNTATIQGTYITTEGKEWTYWADEKNPNFSTIHMIDGDTSVVTAEPDPKNGSILKLTAVAPGKTTITVQFDTSTRTATCDVTVTSDARLILTPADSLRVVQGDTQTIEAKAWDGTQYVENPEIIWQSYNTKIATVDEKGGVTGVKKGTVGVAATWNDVTSSPVQVTVVPSRTLSVTTTWDDDNNRDNKRPEKTTLQLVTTDGENVGDPVELNADNEWKYTWNHLASEDEDGQHISYLVTAIEDETLKAGNYTAEVTRSSSDDDFIVTYKHTIEKTNLTANVTWDDADNQDGIRPKEVTLQLKADGEAVGDGITVRAGNEGDWTKTWTGLPVNKEGAVGQAIEYTVEESGFPEGYTVTVSKDEETGAITVKNSYTPAVKDLTVSAKWDDADNQDGLRPESIEAVLCADGEATDKTVILKAEENWTATIVNMPVYKAGKAITYTLKTVKDVEGYTSAADGTNLTFTHKAAVTSVTASVVWDDAENKDGIRPSSVSFQLKADDTVVGDPITVNANSKWSKTWENLAANKAGTAINYTVEVSGINTGEDQYTVTTSGDAASGFVFTASHVPAEVEITASAVWDDADNQDGIRPESVEAELYADGAATGDKVTLTAANNWTASFGEKELKKDGKSVAYTVKATEAEGYTVDVSGNGVNGFALKYAHTPETISVSVSTVWNDKENQDGNRPTSYSVQLMADGVKSGDKITLDTTNDFSKTWTGLQKYRTGNVGEEIQYTVEVSGLLETYESVVSGTVADGFFVTNTYVPTSVEIPVSVTWDDAENQDGARIEAVEAELYANGEATGNKVTLNAENNWTAKFASVDVKKDGTRIKYEVKGTEADGYDVSVAGDILDEKGLVLTYKHIPAVVNVSVRVSWNDANNQDGIRPTDTLVQLYANGTALGDKAVIESNKEWTKTWLNLPKYKAGKEIAYNVIAYAVSGYTVKVTGNVLEGYKAEYTHNVQKMNVTVQNAWNDLDNVVDSRPAQLVVEIYANGKTTGKRVTLTEANNWKATVSGLDRNAAGKRIQYTGKAVGTPAGYNISVSTDTNGNIKLISNFTTYTKKLRLKLSKTSYVYNGKNAKPKVTVYNGRKKVSSKYYKVTYKNNKKVGYATVIVKGKGKFAKYAGKAAFTIKLKTLKKPSVKKGAKGTLNVSWKRDGQATKYVVQYSQSKKFKGKSTKTVTITNNKIGKTVLKGLTGKKNYYVRVRSCKAVNGREIWSSWSSRSSKVKVK